MSKLMWKCLICGAPNPTALSTCYHCRTERSSESGPPANGTEGAGESERLAGATQQDQQPTQQDNLDGEEDPAARMCRYCGSEVSADVAKCRHCGEWLSEEQSPDPPLSVGQKAVAATIAVLFWFFGIVLGCVFLLGDRKRLGRFYLRWTMIGFVLWTIVFFGYRAAHDTSEYSHANVIGKAPVETAPEPAHGVEGATEERTPPTLEELKTGAEEAVRVMLRGGEYFQNDVVMRSEVHACPQPGYDYSASVTSTDGSNEHVWLYVHPTGGDAAAWEPAPME